MLRFEAPGDLWGGKPSTGLQGHIFESLVRNVTCLIPFVSTCVAWMVCLVSTWKVYVSKSW